MQKDEHEAEHELTDGETEDSDEDPSSELTDGASDDGLQNPKVGDEDSVEEVDIDGEKMGHLNIGKDPSSKSYSISGINRIVGLKLNSDLKLF